MSSSVRRRTSSKSRFVRLSLVCRRCCRICSLWLENGLVLTNTKRSQPSVSMKGQFGPNGALFDGWESRRHNPTYDW